MFSKKIKTLWVIFVIFFLKTFSYATYLNWTTENVDSTYNDNLIQIITNKLVTPVAAWNLDGNIPFQGDNTDNGKYAIKNGCKYVQDDESIKNSWFISASCPEGTVVIYDNLWISTDNTNNVSFTCAVPVSNELLATLQPQVNVWIEWRCSGGDLCKGVEPWYNVDQTHSVQIQLKAAPQSVDVKIWTTTKNIISPIWLNTTTIFVNSSEISVNKNGDYKDSWFTTLDTFSLNGTGWPQWNYWINYITTRVCNHPLDNDWNFVDDPTQTYKLNCTTKTFVVKLSPTSDKNATDFSYLNQEKVSCKSKWYPLPENWQWNFPVMLDWTFYQTCNKAGICTPKAETVCNYTCNEWYIKDSDGPNGPSCYPEKKEFDCNYSSIWWLKLNEEWKKPNWFSTVQNVNKETWKFYWLYSLEYHKYIANINYCAKWCKAGYKLDNNNTCQPVTKIAKCSDFVWKIWNLQKYNAETLIDWNNANIDYQVNQYWEDKVNPTTNELDWKIESNEYDPNDTLLKDNTNPQNPCQKTPVANSVYDNDKWNLVCKNNYIPFDSNNDWIYWSCVSWTWNYALIKVSDHADEYTGSNDNVKKVLEDHQPVVNNIQKESENPISQANCDYVLTGVVYKYWTIPNVCLKTK